MLTISNIDKQTEDIITYIVKKAGGKISHDKYGKSKEEKIMFDGNKDFNELWDNVVKTSKANAKKNSLK